MVTTFQLCVESTIKDDDPFLFTSHCIHHIRLGLHFVANQSFKLNFLYTAASLFNFLYFENSVSYLLNAVLQIFLLFSSSLQQMITLYLPISGLKRNKSPVWKYFC